MSEDIIVLDGFRNTGEAIELATKTLGLPQLAGGSGRGWSRWKLLQQCPYAYHLRYVQKLDLSEFESPALAVGSLVHAWAAVHYLGQMSEAFAVTPEDLKNEVEKQGANPAFLYKAWAVFDAYRAHYEEDYHEPLAVEYTVEDVKTNNTCRYDLIARTRNPPESVTPGVYIVEHKTSSNLSEDVVDGWSIDGEILGEMAFWQRNGLDKKFGKLTGLIVNILVKTKQPQFHRTFVAPVSVHTKAHIRNLAYMTELEKTLRKARKWPQFFGSCIGRWGKCAFYTHCLNRGLE
jgi:hypothetical protein